MSTTDSAKNKEIASLISKIEFRIAELRNTNVLKESIEFYLLNNLVNYRQSLAAESKQDVENAASIFGRSCTDSMDWETKNYREYIQLSTEGHHAAKQFDTKKTHSV